METGGMALDAARTAVSFRLSADADQFLTMAKFRALRLLWARIEESCGTCATHGCYECECRHEPHARTAS